MAMGNTLIIIAYILSTGAIMIILGLALYFRKQTKLLKDKRKREQYNKQQQYNFKDAELW